MATFRRHFAKSRLLSRVVSERGPAAMESQDPIRWAPRSAAECCAVMKNERCENEGSGLLHLECRKTRRLFLFLSGPTGRRSIARGSLPLEVSRAKRAPRAAIYNKRCFSKNGGANPTRRRQNDAPKSLAHLRLKHLLIFLLIIANID
jgi:hypothetical protein